MKSKIPIWKLRLELFLSFILTLFGMGLLTASFLVNPTGVIDGSVLTASGMVFTYSGSLIGIDYNYRAKNKTVESKE